MVEETANPRPALLQGHPPYLKACITKGCRVAPTKPKSQRRALCVVRGDGVSRLGWRGAWGSGWGISRLGRRWSLVCG